MIWLFILLIAAVIIATWNLGDYWEDFGRKGRKNNIDAIAARLQNPLEAEKRPPDADGRAPRGIGESRPQEGRGSERALGKPPEDQL